MCIELTLLGQSKRRMDAFARYVCEPQIQEKLDGKVQGTE